MFVLAGTHDYVYEKMSNIEGSVKMQLYVKLKCPDIGLSVLGPG